jgi:hypothetical protein
MHWKNENFEWKIFHKNVGCLAAYYNPIFSEQFAFERAQDDEKRTRNAKAPPDARYAFEMQFCVWPVRCVIYKILREFCFLVSTMRPNKRKKTFAGPEDAQQLRTVHPHRGQIFDRHR